MDPLPISQSQIPNWNAKNAGEMHTTIHHFLNHRHLLPLIQTIVVSTSTLLHPDNITIYLLPPINSARMDNIEKDHDTQHKYGIKNVQEHLVPHQETIIVLCKENYSEDRSDEDDDTSSVERVNVFLPACVGESQCGWLHNAVMEPSAADDEEAEEDNLQAETSHN